MTKKYLVKFNCGIGEYEHIDNYVFDKKKSEWGYCKEFWGISKKDEAKETCVVRTSEQKEKCHWEKVGDRYVVYRTRDRKVMKSIDYFKPNLKQFFNEKN